MSQSFAVQEIILSRRKHIVYLKNVLARTITHDAEMSLRKEIHDKEQELEYFENSEAFKMKKINSYQMDDGQPSKENEVKA